MTNANELIPLLSKSVQVSIKLEAWPAATSLIALGLCGTLVYGTYKYFEFEKLKYSYDH